MNNLEFFVFVQWVFQKFYALYSITVELETSLKSLPGHYCLRPHIIHIVVWVSRALFCVTVAVYQFFCIWHSVICILHLLKLKLLIKLLYMWQIHVSWRVNMYINYILWWCLSHDNDEVAFPLINKTDFSKIQSHCKIISFHRNCRCFAITQSKISIRQSLVFKYY